MLSNKRRIPSGRARLVSQPSKEMASLMSPLDIRDLRAAFGVSRNTFARLLGYSERAIVDWETRGRPSSSAHQHITEIRRLYDALAAVIDPSSLGAWVQTPNPAFDGLKPLEVIERGETDRIWRMIFDLESGIAT
jgi:DNA-binding transcriptional regulator YiaG